MSILIKPIITEKTTADSEERNRFSFKVAKEANKLEIKEAIEELYGINVEKVRTSIVPGKDKTRYTKSGISKGNTGSYKKAIVEVRSGETIDLYSDI